jgi:hypothetical protein
MTYPRILRVVPLALLMLLMLPIHGSRAAEKAIWGPTTLPWGYGSALPVYRDLGVETFQYQVSWDDVAQWRPADPTDPNDPAYAWRSGLASFIAATQDHPPIDVALLVKNTPGWANAWAGRNRSPTDVRDYANFLRAASRKYPTVRRWMIWGETNRSENWQDGPGRYAELLNAAYAALKAEDPQDIVVGGMTFTYGTPRPAAFIDGMELPDGSRPRLDEYGHNPFTRRCPNLALGPAEAQARDISDVDTLIGEARAAFGPSTKLWLSEFTVSSDRPNRAMTFFVDRGTQAAWLAGAYRIAEQANYVSGLGWFNLHDEADLDNGLTTGLLDPWLGAKPAYWAYQAATVNGPGPPPSCQEQPPPGDPPAGGGPSPSPAGPGQAPLDGRRTPADRRPPRVRLKSPWSISAKRLARRGYRVTVSCDEPCRITTELRGAGRRLGGASASVGRADSRTIRVAVRHRVRTLGITLKVTAADAASNRIVHTRRIRVVPTNR